MAKRKEPAKPNDAGLARKARAAGLREEIAKLAGGEAPRGERPPSPREITDAAARRKWLEEKANPKK